MHSERFRTLLSAHGPYASIHFDDSHDTEDALTQNRLTWRGLRAELDRQGAGAQLLDRLEDAVTAERPTVGRGGRLLVANADGVLLDERLGEPRGTAQARFSELPYLVPAVTHGMDQPSYLVVTVDHSGGDVELHHDGAVTAVTVEAGGYPVHKAGRAETPGYGDPQPRTEENRAKNIRSVADRVTALFDESTPEMVFLVGEVRSRSDLAAALPDRVNDRLVQLEVGARHSGFDPREVDRAISERCGQRRLNEASAVAQRFSAEVGRRSGLATEGLAGVCAALREGAVDTLLLGDLGDATVVSSDDLSTVAPNPNVLSELGTAATHVLRADEALPMAAIAIGADLVELPVGFAPADGVAATLRYPPP